MAETSSDVALSSESANRRLLTTVGLVSAYVSNNSIRPADLVGLIETVYGTLGNLATPAPEPKEVLPPVPAVPVKKSISQEFLICLEDGKKFRSLKRHLGTVYGLTPEQYRAKWGLPRDYPMVAPAYSAVRSQLAKDIGLGRPATPRDVVPVDVEPTVAAGKTGRRKAKTAG